MAGPVKTGGYDRDTRIIEGMARMGWKMRREDFVVRTDNQAAYWHLVRAGCGIGIGQVLAVQDEPDLVRLFEYLATEPLPVWLSSHEAMRATPRIRRVWGALAEGLKRAAGRQDSAGGFAPPDPRRIFAARGRAHS